MSNELDDEFLFDEYDYIEIDINKDSIFDCFISHIEYPDLDDLFQNGPLIGTFYHYVSIEVVEFFASKVPHWNSVIIERHELFGDDIDHKIQQFKENGEFCHLNNDLYVFGETEDAFWILNFDYDVSDCGIGRLPKKIFNDKNEILKLFKNWLELNKDSNDRLPINHTCVITGNYKEIGKITSPIRW